MKNNSFINKESGVSSSKLILHMFEYPNWRILYNMKNLISIFTFALIQ